jgi:hypothetical protein
MENREFSYKKCESAVHQIRPEKNSETCCFKNIFKRIFRMRLKLLTSADKIPTTTRNKNSARYLIIETTFWNYSCWYGYLCTVPSAIWKQHARVSFSKTIDIAQVWSTSAIWKLWKIHECMFFQIALSRPYYLTIIEWGWARYEELSSPKFAVINRSRRLRLITANWGLDNSSSVVRKPNSIIVLLFI